MEVVVNVLKLEFWCNRLRHGCADDVLLVLRSLVDPWLFQMEPLDLY